MFLFCFRAWWLSQISKGEAESNHREKNNSIEHHNVHWLNIPGDWLLHIITAH